MPPTLMQPVKALTFDMYGTLLDLPATFNPGFDAFLKEKGYTGSAAHLGAIWERECLMESMVDTAVGGERTSFEQVRRTTLDQVLARFGVEHTQDDVVGALARAAPNLYPDVIDAMERLRERYTLAILSNGDRNALGRLVNGLGLPVQSFISAEQAGCYKPDQRVYRHGAEQLGLEAGEVMHVAAHPWDLRDAKAVGMRVAYVNREGVPYAVGEPDIEMADLAQFAESVTSA